MSGRKYFHTGAVTSESYWRHEQDVCADMCRLMKDRCDRATADNDPELWEYCKSGQQTLEYPTYFITIAPLEWNFSLPAWLQRYKDAGRLSEVQGPLTIHIHRVIHSVTG